MTLHKEGAGRRRHHSAAKGNPRSGSPRCPHRGVASGVDGTRRPRPGYRRQRGGDGLRSHRPKGTPSRPCPALAPTRQDPHRTDASPGIRHGRSGRPRSPAPRWTIAALRPIPPAAPRQRPPEPRTTTNGRNPHVDPQPRSRLYANTQAWRQGHSALASIGPIHPKLDVTQQRGRRSRQTSISVPSRSRSPPNSRSHGNSVEKIRIHAVIDPC